MKKYIPLLSILLCSSALLVTGCDNKKTPDTTTTNPTVGTNPDANPSTKSSSELSIPVINSYLFHTEPELLPFSKAIKQQHIQSASSDKIINYNDQGFVANYNLDGLQAEINYDTAKYTYGMKDTRSDYAITFDANKNILGMKNDQDDIVAISEYDEQGHLIETTLSHFAENNVIFKSQIIYDQDRVELVLYNAYVPVDEKTKFPILSQEKDVIYNANKQLEKTINKTFKLTSDGKIIINDKNEKEVELTETCTYSDYNENNDWTKAICVTTGEESKTVNLTRTIQYE